MSSTIITSIHKPALDVETDDEINTYFSKLNELSGPDMCVEFNNVLAAKHNIKSLPSAISDFSESQKIMASLNNKAAYICMLILGKDKVLNYENGDSRAFIQLLDNFDAQVSTRDLDSESHGRAIFQLLYENV